MKRKRLTILLLFLPLVVLMTVSVGVIYREYLQQRLNQDLIASLKRDDVGAEVRLLNAGADANAREMGDRPVTFWSVMRDYWQRIRTGKPAKIEFHKPAILVFEDNFEGSRLAEKAWIAQTVPLLDHGANINNQDEYGRTALWEACASDYSDLARLLIDRGADVNLPDYEECMPLICSIANKNSGLVRALLIAGTKVNHRDKDGHTPLWQSGKSSFIILRPYIKKTNIQTELKSSQEIVRLLQQSGAHE